MPVEEPVLSATTHEVVAASSALEQVVAAATEHDVVALQSAQDVVASAGLSPFSRRRPTWTNTFS